MLNRNPQDYNTFERVPTVKKEPKKRKTYCITLALFLIALSAVALYLGGMTKSKQGYLRMSIHSTNESKRVNFGNLGSVKNLSQIFESLANAAQKAGTIVNGSEAVAKMTNQSKSEISRVVEEIKGIESNALKWATTAIETLQNVGKNISKVITGVNDNIGNVTSSTGHHVASMAQAAKLEVTRIENIIMQGINYVPSANNKSEQK